MIRAGLLLLTALALPAAAASDCKKHEAPACSSWYDQFDTMYALESCKRDLDTYKDKVETFADCVKEEAEKLKKDLKKAAENFERRASKGVSGR